ncbi:MAG: toll/interleukin-1 receptor domain-containing protein [Magnetococcales bacterium]|nr:toll/interleukin-1 receptor domain-containing protein [Magnetococcales bacterium]
MSDTKYEYDLFLSHSSKDKSVVRPLAERLDKDGVKVWFDEWDIQPADNIFLEIEKGLKKSHKVAFIMSDNFLKHEWPEFERNTVMFRNPSNSQRRFVCLKLDDCTLPETLELFKYIDYSQETNKAYTQLLDFCKPKNKSNQNKKPIISLSHLPNTSKDLFGRDNELKKLSDAWENPDIRLFSLVAWGGVGKSALVNRWLGLQDRVNYSWAKRVYGWSFYSQGTKEDRQASSDHFFASILDWFGVPKEEQPNNGHDRAMMLANKCEKQKTLLILDGMEPLQFTPGAMGGGLRDGGMATLLKELVRRMNGLCLITTRWAITDLDQFEGGPLQRIDLEELSVAAGVELLKSFKVDGAAQEMEKAVTEFAGHALALTLLGEYLQIVHEGDVRRRDLIADLREEPGKGGHARRVMDSYIKWLQVDNPAALEILKLMGLFDRPVPKGAMAVLRAAPAIAGLTGNISQLGQSKWAFVINILRKFRILNSNTEQIDDTQWAFTVEHLRKMRLLAPVQGENRSVLDCHPLIREHFGEILQKQQPKAWQEAHNRLYEYYKNLAPHQPDTLEEMEPLFAAVAHCCRAGRHEEALDEVYYSRIARDGKTDYCGSILGAYGSDLGALANFFKKPWQEIDGEISDDWKAFLFSSAAFRLRALGRFSEVVEPFKAGLALYTANEEWKNAASIAINLSDFYLNQGEVEEALRWAKEAIDFIKKVDESFWLAAFTAKHGDVLHQSGQLEMAEELFQAGESRQKEVQHDYRFLYSVWGYQYCDLLLQKGEYEEVLERAEQTLEWVTDTEDLLSIALDKLSLGRAYHQMSLSNKSQDFSHADKWLNAAVKKLRQANALDELPRGLLARAALWRDMGSFVAARKDLAETFDICQRGNSLLFLTDYHLESARLALADGGDKKVAGEHLRKARDLVDQTGYHRRDGEVEQLFFELAC